jgi:zinc D-Ala-D-Ala carboxypeptidase
MACNEPARTAARRIRSTTLAAFAFVSATFIGVVTGQLVGSSLASSSSAPSVRRGLTVFDEKSPAVTNLDPDLRRALRHAARDAAEYRVEIVVNSGWRSPKYQERLLRQAVSKYGSEENAARWVATADTSSHVSGHAVDIGPSRAMAWLSKHGAQYRLCQIYRNEPWHYELRPEAADDGCPSMYADPRHDPRMHQ